MPKIINNESSIYNGISQQNNELRLPSQVQDAYNAKFSVAHGLEKRPPAINVLSESDSYDMSCKVHPLDISDSDQYIIVFDKSSGTKGNKAYDLEGNGYPVITQDVDVDTYISTETPDADLRLTTVLSTTVIANKSISVQMDTSSPTPSLGTEKYIWFSNGVQQVERTITLDGVDLVIAKDTDNDTKHLVDETMTWLGTQTGFTGTRISDSVVKVEKDDSGEFDLSATDSYSDSTVSVAPARGTNKEDLPPKASDDQVIKIIIDGDDETVYYLKYDSESNAWFETVGENVSTDFDATTMPHQMTILIDDGVGSVTGTPNQKYFYISRITWAGRTTGDDESSPNPSFVGDTINDVFYFKNRLGFLTTESVSCSALDDIYNFWPATVKEVLDDDPIDLSVSTTRSVILEFATPFPDSMAILGSNQQYSLHSDGKPFTSANATIDPSTSYNISSIAKPQSVGSSVYMVVPMDSFSAVREYAVVPDSLVTEASDVTGHVPRLIPSSVKQIIPETNLEYVFLLDKEDVDSNNDYTMWTYSFFWSGNEKVQSAWSKWTLWFKPLGGWVFDGKLYLIGTETINDTASTILVSLGLETKAVDIEGFKNSEPLVDRLSLIEEEDVVPSDNIAVVNVDQDTYNAFEGIEGAEFSLVDRASGLTGEYIDRFENNGEYFGRFNLKVVGKPSFYDKNNNNLIGYHPIGGLI